MAKPYSYDLRKKIIEYVKEGNSCNKAASKFEVSGNAVRSWYKRYKDEGHYIAKKVGGKKGRVGPEEIADYIEKNPDFKSADMGEHFGMTSAGAFYWLKKLGYSYKKKRLPMWKQAKKSVEDMKIQ